MIFRQKYCIFIVLKKVGLKVKIFNWPINLEVFQIGLKGGTQKGTKGGVL